MIAWLSSKLGVEERCRAYALFPNFDPYDNSDVDDGDREDSPLEAYCAHAVQEAFDETIKEKRFLISEIGKLQPWGGCVAVPTALVDVWSESEVSELLGVDEEKPILNRHVGVENLKRLIDRECVSGLGESDILKTLKRNSVPKPKTWSQLLNLWIYLKSDLVEDSYGQDNVRIFPIQGKDSLYPANEVIHVAEKKVLRSSDDREFLARYAPVLDQKWLRFLASQRRKAEKEGDKPLLKQVKAADAILKALGCYATLDVSELIEKASEHFFEQEDCNRNDCVRLAHIAAALHAPVPESFQFVTRDGYRREVAFGILADVGNNIADFADDNWWNEHVLHGDYSRSGASCPESEWRAWIASEGSRLITFVPLDPLDEEKAIVKDRLRIVDLLRERGATKPPGYKYDNSKFECTDWDFDESLWQHWQSIASKDENFWGRLLAQIFGQTRRFWSEKLECLVKQVKGGGSGSITDEKLCSGWIAKLRQLPCLEDTSGKFHLPSFLLCRTSQNKSLLPFELFVREDFDTEENRPLLKALRVNTEAAGADRLLDRLQVCAAAQSPSIDEVLNLYRDLDQIVSGGSMKDRLHVHDVFAKEALILTADEQWERLSAYLCSNETEIPGAAVVHPSVRDLTIWSKIGVAPQPEVGLVLEWLKDSLASGQRLSANVVCRIQSFLPQHPERIWSECGHWLNLEGEWAPVKSLSYALTDDSLPWDHLYSQVKQMTADFRRLRIETRRNPPFSDVPTLQECLKERIAKLSSRLPKAEIKPWLAALGAGLLRIRSANPDDTRRNQELGNRLAVTVWQVVPGIEIVPFLDGKRAGDSRQADAFWNEAVLYVAGQATAKMARPVTSELSRGFDAAISDAIKSSYDRTLSYVTEYLEAAFSLAPLEEVEPADFAPVNSDDSGDENDLNTSLTGSAGPTTTADAIQSLLGTAATGQTPLPGELDRPDGPTSSRPGSRTGTQSTSATPRDDDVDDGDERGDDGNGQTPSPGPRPRGVRRGRAVLRSYVMPDRPDDGSPKDEDGQAHRTETDQAGVNRVLEYERLAGRTPREMPHTHEGYDVESSKDGVKIERFIEVKSLSGDWNDGYAVLTNPQFDKATELRDRYWLYVVERAQHDDSRLHCIQDPAGKANRFMFDSGWRQVAEEPIDEDEAEAVAPK
ncbi:MAG: DUF3883 domain-containing protein [Planctomycetia bacterium]|nr:DUF3883 domain-containing protein [Planctomycetia bacterium]